MVNELDEFNDFKAPGAESTYVSEPLIEEKGKDLTEVEFYKEDFDKQLLMEDYPKDKLTEIIIEYIQSCGDVNEVNICSYNSKNGVALDGWGFYGDEESTTIDLFLTTYVDPDKGKRISASEIDRQFNWLQRFFEQSLGETMLTKFADDKLSDLYQVADLIHSTKKINRIRLFLLTNAIAPLGYDKKNIDLGEDTVCEFYVWDVRRVMQQDNIISGRNSVVVNFEREYNCSLPCIQMPDISQYVRCYLCIIPGNILANIYKEYHQQLLEKNVRTFLQFKGASNKGIRDTLIGHTATYAERNKGIGDSAPEPDMFFAYNNGISATASEVELNDERTAITCIKSWQIVNGGQTTAAISTVMNMDNVDKSQLASSVYVAMKISVIKKKDNNKDQDNNIENQIVSKISRYANTQSAVKKSDFNINEKFLVELEQCSREEWVLNANKKPVNKWFFERTRGQYLDKAKRMGNAKAEKEFYAEYPKSQMFDKNMLFRYIMSWEQEPALARDGGENNFGKFVEKMKRNGVTFDKLHYQRAIGKAILFKAIDAFYGKDGLGMLGFKADTVAYTMSVLSLKSHRSLNLDKLWEEQYVISSSVYNELSIDIYSVYARLVRGEEYITYKIKEPYTDSHGVRKTHFAEKEIPQEDIERLKETTLYNILLYVKKITPLIRKHLTELNEGESLNSWTKKLSCWAGLKSKLAKEGVKYDIPAELLTNSTDSDGFISEGQQKTIDDTKEIDAATWLSINRWSKENPGNLTPREQAFIGQVGFAISRKRPLSYKQSKWALDIYDKARDRGWSEDYIER